MPLLLLPVLLVALVLLWLLLLPVLLLQRYRMGRARQRAIGWVVGVNAWLLLTSAVSLLAGAWVAERWIADAMSFAAGGLAVGILLGMLGTRLARLETTGAGIFHTPNRWLALLLTLAIALRIGLGAWQGWQHLHAGHAVQGLLDQQGSLLALGGVLLGHYLAYAWGLRRALRSAP
jgi:hypothetical protein